MTTEDILRDQEKEKAPEEVFPVFKKITERFGSLFAGVSIVIPAELKKKQLMDTLHFGHPGSTIVQAESNLF